MLVEKDEDGYYLGSVVELPGCHTQARTLDQLTQRVKEAVEALEGGLAASMVNGMAETNKP